MEYTTARISVKLREYLRKKQKFREDFDELLKRLLEFDEPKKAHT